MRADLLLAFLLVSLPICFVRPFYGIILWTIIAFLNPQEYAWSDSFPWALAVAIPTIAGFAIFSRGWVGRIMSRESFLIAVLWIWFTITSLISTHTLVFIPHAADTWYRWSFVSKVLLMTIVTMGVIDSFARLRTLMLVIAGCFGIFVVKSLPFMILTGGEFRLYGPPHSMIADNNDFGLALNMTLPVFFFLAQTEERPWARKLFGFLFLVTIPAVFFTYSRGALLGMIAVMMLMFFRLNMQQRLLLSIVVVIGVTVAVFFAPEEWRHRMDPTRSDAVDASAQSRLNAWTFSWRLASDYPLTGGGFDTFTRELFDRYAPHTADIHGPHSIYFGVLAEHGFPGLFLYLLLPAFCFATTRRIVKVGRSLGDHNLVSYANMFRFSIVGFMVSGAFLGRAYFDYFFTIVAGIVVLKKICRAEEREAAEVELSPEELPA